LSNWTTSIVSILALLGACAAAPSPVDRVRELSDADVLSTAHSGFDKDQKMGRSEVLGVYRGITLVADYLCSDLCPAYTTRIIHYTLPPDESCARAGGVVRMRNVPVSIAVTRRPFCVPAVIADSD
jgi:hypothetical protein